MMNTVEPYASELSKSRGFALSGSMNESITGAGREILLAELVELSRLGRFNDVELEEAKCLVGIYTNRRGVIAALELERSVARLLAKTARRRGEYGLESVYRRKAGLISDELGGLYYAAQLRERSHAAVFTSAAAAADAHWANVAKG
jgi:hypothetical protein